MELSSKTARELAAWLKACVRLTPGTRVIHPDCQDGTLLATLAESTGAETVGITVSPDDAEQARRHLNTVHCCHPLHEILISARCGGVIVITPPSRSLLETQHEATEVDLVSRTVLRYQRCLQQGGVLVLITHFDWIPALTSALAPWHRLTVLVTPPHVFKLPQCPGLTIVLGQKGERTAEAVRTNRHLLQSLQSIPPAEAPHVLPRLDTYGGGPFSPPPAEKLEPLTVRTSPTSPTAMWDIVRRSPCFSRFHELTRIPERNTVESLLPPKKGHLALLLAAGVIDGEIKKGGRRLLVKGRVRKSEVQDPDHTSPPDGPDQMKVKDRYHIVMTVLDLSSGELHELRSEEDTGNADGNR